MRSPEPPRPRDPLIAQGAIERTPVPSDVRAWGPATAGGVWVGQFVDPIRGDCTYLVGCLSTRAAALIDPAPSAENAVAHLVEEVGWKLRYVLHTRCEEHDPGNARYRELIRTLGLEEPEPTYTSPWAELPSVWPAGRAGEDALQVQVDAQEIELAMHRGDVAGEPRYTAGWGAKGSDMRGRFGGLRLPLGSFWIDVLATRGPRPRLAFLALDRMFTGHRIRAAAGEDLSTPEELLDLPVGILVYPGWAHDALFVSTVAQEAAWGSLSRRPADAG